MEKTVVKSKNIFARIFQYFKTLSPLVLMQLKDKLDLSFLKSKKKTLFKIIYSILLFVGLTAIIWFIFNLIVNLSLFSLLKILNFRAFLVLMTVLMIFSFLSRLTNITKMEQWSLYHFDFFFSLSIISLSFIRSTWIVHSSLIN